MQKFQEGAPRWAHKGTMSWTLWISEPQLAVKSLCQQGSLIQLLIVTFLARFSGACGIFGVAQARAGVTALIDKQPKWKQGDLDSS